MDIKRFYKVTAVGGELKAPKCINFYFTNPCEAVTAEKSGYNGYQCIRFEQVDLTADRIEWLKKLGHKFIGEGEQSPYANELRGEIMNKYCIKMYDENSVGSELMAVKYCYNADEADAYAREMSWSYDWVEVSNSEDNEKVYYVQGRIK